MTAPPPVRALLDAGHVADHNLIRTVLLELQDSGGLAQHYIEINPHMTPTSHVNWNTVAAAASYIMGGYNQSSNVQNDEISWAVSLDSGTWALEVMHPTTTDAGIITVTIDGTSVGTIDQYSATLTRNVKTLIPGISVAAAGTKTLKFAMLTKNASATAYRGYVQWVTLRRTGA